MPLEAWLPINFKLPDGKSTKRPLFEGNNWQIYSTKVAGRVLVAKEDLVKMWSDSGLIQEELFDTFQFGKVKFYFYTSSEGYTLSPIEESPSPEDKSEALSFAETLRSTRLYDQTSSLHDGIYVEKLSRIMPVNSLSVNVSDDVVLGAWLTGGVPVSVHSFRRLCALMTWLQPSDIQDIVKQAGIDITAVAERKNVATKDGEQKIQKKEFRLAGRGKLETFFKEHIIDIIENHERYKKLGINFPSAVILHGPPGCGKTFSVEQLVGYLDWPCFEIAASSVASPYIHETSKKVAEVFDQAIQNAPSVLIIDEMEAFLTDRQSGTGHHRIEEVAEFLRRIPEAVNSQVLIIAMTNHIEMIDKAILRRGRFDHVVEVGMASKEEIKELLEKLIKEIPSTEDIDISKIANDLKGRPLSDVSFVIREGARLAAHAGKDKIDKESILQAIKNSPARDKSEDPKRKIGF